MVGKKNINTANLEEILNILSSICDMDISYLGKEGNLFYVLSGKKAPRLYLIDAATLELEKPEVVSDIGNKDLWSSRKHGITWKTKPQVLDSIAAAYELMDHKEGEQEEWYAEPYDFAEDGTLLERIRQPLWSDGVPTQLNNATHLHGRLGDYSITIATGGGYYRGGVSSRGISEARALMKLHRK